MNTFGNQFRITTWGESHGPAIGVVIDGCPAGLSINNEELSLFLGQNDRPIPELATGRCEANQAVILSGLDNHITLGTPISILIENTDYCRKDYEQINQVFRPGHGDYTYFKKYGTPTQSGGGRASGRECVCRIASGYIAGKLIAQILPHFEIHSELTKLAGMDISDPADWEKAVNRAMQIGYAGDSSGGVIRITVKGLPAGLGNPVFGGMNACLAAGLLSIGSVKSLEIGAGKSSADSIGSDFQDDFIETKEGLGFDSNQHGGILAGITSGEDLVLTLAVKPTPTINLPKNGATPGGKIKTISINGRHDKNITPRIIPVAEAMIKLIVVDQLIICGYLNKDRIMAAKQNEKKEAVV
ncbi:MAG: chorismate synthase [Spirochaetes bacterium]|nr:chorismate synthase [Spirochaetota bacterium]